MALIAHYRLNGDGNDSIGGLNGSPSNITWLPGKVGTAGKFNGVDANMLVADERLNLRVALSLSCWLRVDAITSWKRVIQRGPHTNYQLDMAPRSSNTQFALRSAVYNDAGEYVWTYSHNIDIGTFVHVAMVIGDGFNRLYVDGALAGESLWNDLISDQPLSSFCIGSDPRGVASTFFDGLIQDVRVYDHALSPREVRDLSLGLISHYRLYGDTTDAAGTGLIGIGSGSFVDSEIGVVADVAGTNALVPLEHAPLRLKGETIVFREKCDFLRANSTGGGFSNWVVQWGDYYTNNSGGFGLQSGSFSHYLKGPTSSGWTDSGSSAEAAARFDQGGWIDYAVVFGDDDTISLYMDGERVVHFSLAQPYTGLTSGGVSFGNNMLAQVSDVRLYAKAMTQAEIVELHQQRASIDSSGSLIARELFETGYKPPLGPSYDVWTAGTTGAEPGFATNGSAAKNSRVIDDGPHGEQAVLWRATNTDTASTADGGWIASSFPIDNTKTYRFSVWMRRRVQGNGTGYWGCNGYGSTNGVLNLGALTNNTNPYFWSGGVNESWGWFLIVGHIHPAGYTGPIHPDSARYTKDGYLGPISRDFVWRPETTSVRHRSYLYYSTDLTTVQDMAYPRVDLCDGTEPTIQQLIDGFDLRWSQNNFPRQLAVQERLLLPSASEVGVTRGLVAWYPLIGDTQDYAGTNHGVNSGASPTPYGYEFLADDFVDTSFKHTEPMSELTVSMMFKATSNGFLLSTDRSEFWRVEIGGNAGSVSGQVGVSHVVDGVVKDNFDAPVNVLDDQWHNVTFVFDSGTSLLYLDGNLENTLVSTGLLGRNVERFLGIATNVEADGVRSGTWGAVATLRDIRVYSVALTADEVARQTAFGFKQAALSMAPDCVYTQGQLKEVAA